RRDRASLPTKKNASFPFPPTWSLPCTPLQGNTVDILWSLLPFRDESGAVTGLLCSGAPSTASQAVALTPLTSPSSSRYRPLLEAIPYGVILLDDQGQVTYENGGLTLLSGHQITPFTSITDWLRKVLGEAESTEATITAWCTSLLERKETVSLTITAADQTSLPLLFEPSQVEGRGVVVTVSEDRTTLEVPGEMNDHTARLFFQRTGFAIAVEDSHGHLIEANPACQALTRQPAEVIAQVGLKKLLHPEDQIAVEARIAQVRKAPSFTYDPMDVRLRQPSSDGEDVFQKVCLQISGIPNPNGHLLYLAYLLSRPVDEGQHLPRNRELLLDSLPDLLILADRSGDVLDAIPSASGFLFPSTEPLMGQRLARLLPSLGDPESVHHWIRSAAEQGAAQSKTFRDPVTGKPLEARLSDAGAGRVILSVREKQAQAASVSDHRHIAFQRIADAVVVADHTGQIIDWNPAATDLFGSTRDSMLGRSLSTIFSPQDPVSFNHQLADALSYQGEWSGTAEFIRGDGSPGTCEVHYAAATIEESDHPVIIGINRRPQSPPESPKTEKVDSELWDSLKLLGTLSGLDFRQAATHDLRQSLRKNSSRLQTIAFAHQSLEKMESGAVLNLSHFLQKISTQVFQSHVESDQEVNLQLQCPELLVPVSSAIPFGLVLEEWLQDILPQVRQNEASSALTISVQLTDTELELRIETPGAPLVLDQGPSPDVLQSSLTQFLATQLQAEISPLPDSGNSIALRVPIVSDAAETA
ncbi:MAG: PAS domain-containing protein, partial [Verrucomicrobiota bacterium]